MPTATEKATVSIDLWINQNQAQAGTQEGTRGTEADNALYWAWKKRWKQQTEGRPSRIADEGPPKLLFTDRALKKHQSLTKAQSSLLVQARTGTIGLRAFLFQQQVPGIPTPYCTCGEGRETVEHLVVWCPIPPKPRTWLRTNIRTYRDLSLVLQGMDAWNLRLLEKVLGWLMDSGRLVEYSLARRLELEAGEGKEEEQEGEAVAETRVED